MGKPDMHGGAKGSKAIKGTEGKRKGRKAQKRQVQFSECIGDYGHLKLMNIKIAKQEFKSRGMRTLPENLCLSPGKADKQQIIRLFERFLRS